MRDCWCSLCFWKLAFQFLLQKWLWLASNWKVCLSIWGYHSNRCNAPATREGFTLIFLETVLNDRLKEILWWGLLVDKEMQPDVVKPQWSRRTGFIASCQGIFIYLFILTQKELQVVQLNPLALSHKLQISNMCSVVWSDTASFFASMSSSYYRLHSLCTGGHVNEILVYTFSEETINFSGAGTAVPFVLWDSRE